MISLPCKQGPLDGENALIDGGVELFWVIWEPFAMLPRLVSNRADLKYDDIADAVGLYQRCVMILNRHREDFLMYRELPGRRASGEDATVAET